MTTNLHRFGIDAFQRLLRLIAVVKIINGRIRLLILKTSTSIYKTCIMIVFIRTLICHIFVI
jgi:hypothetical protein